MILVLMRSLITLVLVSSLTIRFQAIHSRDNSLSEHDVSAAMAHIVQISGLQVLENPHKPPAVLAPVVYFQRSECEGKSLAMPFMWNIEPMTILSQAKKPRDPHHFWYFGTNWDGQKQPRVEMFLLWLKYSLMDTFGESPYRPINFVIATSDPEGCHAKENVAWENIWLKR